MIRLSVTWLDALRRYRKYENATLEELIATIRKTSVATPQMLTGTAFHQALEFALEGDVFDLFKINGIEFDFKLDAQLELPMVRELKGEKEYETSYGPVTLVGKIDGMDGNIIRDYKVTTKSYDPMKFAANLQWRAYLDIFGADEFLYQVFVGGFNKKGDVFVIRGFETLSLYSYLGMGVEVQEAVEDLTAFYVEHVQPT